MKNVRTVIAHEGQPYVDQPIMETVSKASPLALDINGGLLSMAGRMPYTFGKPDEQVWKASVAAIVERALAIKPRIQNLVGHERTRLQWMKPDGKGGLVPKGKR